MLEAHQVHVHRQTQAPRRRNTQLDTSSASIDGITGITWGNHDSINFKLNTFSNLFNFKLNTFFIVKNDVTKHTMSTTAHAFLQRHMHSRQEQHKRRRMKHPDTSSASMPSIDGMLKF